MLGLTLVACAPVTTTSMPEPDGSSEIEDNPNAGENFGENPIEPANVEENVDPASDDTLGGNVIDEDAGQSWHVVSEISDDVLVIFPIAETFYRFHANGTLKQIELVPASNSDTAVDNAGFEPVNFIVPVGVDTEILRRVVSEEETGLVSEERLFQLIDASELTFAEDGTVTFFLDTTLRMEAYFDSTFDEEEAVLVIVNQDHLATVTTGRLSDDGRSIEWLSVQGEGKQINTFVGLPPQENTYVIDDENSGVSQAPWTLATDE